MNFGTYGFPKGLGINSGFFGLPSSYNIWNPSVISPVLWFDSSDISSITQSSNLITSWSSKGIVSVNAIATGGLPSYNVYQTNSKNLVSCRGRGVGMQTGYTLSTPYSIILVSRNYSIGRVIQSGTINALMCPSARSNSFFVSSNVRDASLTTAGTFSIITMKILGATASELWYNSVNYANGTTHGNWGTFNIGNLGFISSEDSQSDIAEIIVLNYSISTYDREKLEGYLAWKWGLIGDLPTNHPYKYSQPTT
jgi:hypothetical protein